MNEYRRVVVTGMGVVSPVGSDMETAWGNLVSGCNGIGPITHFDTTNYKAKLGVSEILAAGRGQWPPLHRSGNRLGQGLLGQALRPVAGGQRGDGI